MVIAPVNQNDVRVAALQGASRDGPSKSGADDHLRFRLAPGAPAMGELSLSRGQATSKALRRTSCSVSLIARLWVD